MLNKKNLTQKAKQYLTLFIGHSEKWQNYRDKKQIYQGFWMPGTEYVDRGQ